MMKISVATFFLASLGGPCLAYGQAPILSPDEGEERVQKVDELGRDKTETKFSSQIASSKCVIPEGANLDLTPGGIVEFQARPDRTKNPSLDSSYFNYAYRVKPRLPIPNCDPAGMWVYHPMQDPSRRNNVALFKEKMTTTQNPRFVQTIQIKETVRALDAEVGDRIINQGLMHDQIENDARSLVEGLDGMNRAPIKAGEGPTPPADCDDGSCKQERTTPAQVGYEQCTSRNNYLEHALDTAAEPSLSYSHGDATDEVSMCIYHAQQLAMKGGRPSPYAQCKPGQARPSRIAGRPCQSKAYHSFVSNAYSDVMDCFDLNPKELIPLIAHESGFQMNAWSQTGAAGFGQFTQSAISEVNSRYIKEYQRRANDSPKKTCQRLKPILSQPMKDRPSQRCDAMMPPNRAVMNMVYSAIYFETNKKRMIDFVSGRIAKNNQRVGRQDWALGSKAEQEIGMKLAYLAHNIGPGQARRLYTAFTTVVMQYGNQDPAKAKDLLDPTKPTFQAWIKAHAGNIAGQPREFLNKVNSMKLALNARMKGAGQCAAY